MKKQNLLINVSGGRSSAMMAFHVSTHPKYASFNKLFVFCNTGQERKETIDFLKNIVKFWSIDLHLIEGVYSNLKGVGCSARRVSFDELDMSSRIFSNAIDHLQKNRWVGVPNQATPYCSVYLKVRPANWYAKKYFGTVKFKSAIGYRLEDMPKRISWAEIKMVKKQIFPLLTDFDLPVNLQDIDSFFLKQLFSLTILGHLGNCRYCWKKSFKTIEENIRFDLLNHDFSVIDWYRIEESKHRNLFFRSNKSIDDLLKSALLPKTGILDFTDDDNFDGCICSI